MTRKLSLVLMLVFALAVPALADTDEEKFLEKAERVNESVADTHVKLAKWCFRRGLNENARREIARALEVYPEHEDAMEALGYERKRVDGERKWVLDEDDAPPEKDHPDADPRDHDTYAKERDDVYLELAEEYVELAGDALKLELETHATAVFQQALIYDATNEEALKGAGWVKDELGEWISPGESEERELTREALEDAPEAELVDGLPDWTARVFGGSQDGRKHGHVTVIATTGNHSDAGQYAHAASFLVKESLGGDLEELRVLLAADREQHKNYVTTRHPGIPGLVQNDWILGRDEVEILIDDDDDELTMERVVYAVTVHEIRRRCGEVRHPWFEYGMATNMTRRLLGSIRTAEFGDEPSGPTEAGRWKRTLKQLVSQDRQPRLRDLVVERDPEEHQVMLAHFFTTYLTRQRQAALGAFCQAYKAEGDAETSFRNAFGEDVEGLEKKFIEWLKMN